MESPFLKVPVSEIKNYHTWNNNEDEIFQKSPIVDPGNLSKEEFFDSAFSNEEFMQAEEVNNYEMLENQLAPVVSAIKIGEATFTIADAALANDEEYKEPVFSGNPLLIIPKNRTLQISKNFQAGEFAQAQSGKYKFSFARIDPLLVDNLQRLRSFFGKQMSIVDA